MLITYKKLSLYFFYYIIISVKTSGNTDSYDGFFYR